MGRQVVGIGSRPARRLGVLCVVVLLLASGAQAAARPVPQQAPGTGYALAATWAEVGAPRRVIAGPDGFIYVLGDQEIRRLEPDGTPAGQVMPSAPRLWEIAVDGAGILYGASGSEVRRLAADGRATWSAPIRSDKPSVLIPYDVQPYTAALAWDGGSRVTLLYDSYKVDTNNAWLRFHQTNNGLDLPGAGFLFPTHAYWDLDYHNSQAYVLNRTTNEFRPQPQVEVYDLNGHAASVAPIPLPAPAERIAVAGDGSVFAISEGRWLYHVGADGQVLDSWDAAGSRPGVRSRVTDLAVDSAGRVYVADPTQGQVRVYTPQEGVVNPRPQPGGAGLACQLLPNKWAEPTYLRLGEVTQVTLTLGGDCPVQAERADIVLVVDRSNSMSYEGGAKMVGAKAGVRSFVELVDTSKHQLSLVAFGSYADMLVTLTQDKAAILRAVDGLQPLGGQAGGTEIAAGLHKATDELLGPRARRDEQTKPIVVLMTDGVAFNSTRLTTVAAADRARAEGVTVFAIGYGEDVEPDLLRLVARAPELYEFAADAAFLRTVYERLGRYISALFLLRDLTIVDEVPGKMTFRPDLPAEPPPDYDPVARTLTWRFARVGFAPPLRMTYWLEPQETGTWPTNVQAIYDGFDGFDQPQRGPFPIPQVIVWAPTETPTVEATLTPSPSPSSTATASPSPSPSVTPIPTASPQHSTPTDTPTETPTLRPSPTTTPTRTATATRTPTVPPTSGPSPTPTPSGRTIYVTVLFNDKCFQRFTDTVLILDSSTTMLRRGEDGRTKLAAAKDAARAYMDALQFSTDPLGRHDQVALVWFNDRAAVIQGLTNDRAALEQALGRIPTVEGSRLDLGLLEAHKEMILSPYRVLANNPVIIFLSDGIPNRTTVEETIQRADAAKLDAISVFSVGFGDDVRDDVMRRIASQPEMYYRSTGNQDLERIYRQIAGDVVCR